MLVSSSPIAGDAASLSRDALTLTMQAAELTTSFIGQLEAVGGMEHWTVYAALHLPDNRERKHAVMDLLCRHAPIFSTDGRKRAFLLQVALVTQSLPAW